MKNTCELTIYTASAALSYEVVASGDDFQDKLAAALGEGTVILETVEGSELILNAVNVVAIEVHAVVNNGEKLQNSPPV